MLFKVQKTILICFAFFATNRVHAAANSPEAVTEDNIELVEGESLSKKTMDYYLCLKASYQLGVGKVEEALTTNDKLMKQTQNPFANESSIRLFYEIGQLEKIAKLYEANEDIFGKAFENNLEMQIIFAQSLLSIDKDEKAEKLFLDLSKKYPDNDQVAYYTAVTYIKRNQPEKATLFIDKCINNKNLKAKHFLFHFLKSKIFMQSNQLAKALEEINKSLELFPRFDKAWLLKAILQEQQGQINEAIKGYKHFLNLGGADESVEKQLIQLLFTQKRFSEAFDYLKKIKHDSPDYYFDLALISFKDGKYKVALENIDTVLEKNPEYQKAYILKVEVLLALKSTKELLKFMEKWLIRTPNDQAAIHTLLLCQEHFSLKQLSDLLETVAKTHPDNLYILATLADLYIEQKNFDDSLKCLSRLSQLEQLDSEIKNKITYQTAYIYFVTDEFDKLEKTLEPILEQQTPYAPSCNLLAYHYATTNKNLEKAMELAEKALQNDSTSPQYIDTKGFILLKQNKKAAAAKTFKAALKFAPDEKEIIEHLQQAEN